MIFIPNCKVNSLLQFWLDLADLLEQVLLFYQFLQLKHLNQPDIQRPEHHLLLKISTCLEQTVYRGYKLHCIQRL